MNSNYTLILVSKSPRRQQILKTAGYSFQTMEIRSDESYPDDLPVDKIALFLAEKKAKAVEDKQGDDKLLITADTVVIHENKILEKPSNRDEAILMLQNLSGTSHKVITGVCIYNKGKTELFDDTTIVHFKDLQEQEILYYIDNNKPFDKAGAYGIQEWIGMTGVHKIEGSYFNVVGLPIHKVYQHLKGYGVFPDKFTGE